MYEVTTKALIQAKIHPKTSKKQIKYRQLPEPIDARLAWIFCHTDIAVLNVYFDTTTVLKLKSEKRQTWIDYFSSVGGAMGLCIGLSIKALRNWKIFLKALFKYDYNDRTELKYSLQMMIQDPTWALSKQ